MVETFILTAYTAGFDMRARVLHHHMHMLVIGIAAILWQFVAWNPRDGDDEIRQKYGKSDFQLSYKIGFKMVLDGSWRHAKYMKR